MLRPALLLLAPLLGSAFQLHAAGPMALRLSVSAVGSRHAAAVLARARTARARHTGVLTLSAQRSPPPPPDGDGSRTLSKAELADLNIQLLESGELRPSGSTHPRRTRGARAGSCGDDHWVKAGSHERAHA
jgi:hypothetical protein